MAQNGTIYEHEHGPRGGDEVNIIKPGQNYGWPITTHGLDYNGAYVSPFQEREGIKSAAHIWVPSVAPSGLAVYEGDAFAAWRGNLFVGALVNNDVRRLTLEGDTVVAEEILFAELDQRSPRYSGQPRWLALHHHRRSTGTSGAGITKVNS